MRDILPHLFPDCRRTPRNPLLPCAYGRNPRNRSITRMSGIMGRLLVPDTT
ncbi:unnamed protein product, partial [Nesidiocoris tenuis]